MHIEPLEEAALGRWTTFALVELQRQAFRYLDVRGRLAEQLLDAYESVTLDDASMAIQAQIGIELEDPVRKGGVSGLRVGYEEQAARDIPRFQRESWAFLRKAESLLGVKRYPRVGVRFLFEVPAVDYAIAARQFVGLSARDGWRLGHYGVRLDTEANGWELVVRIAPVRAPQTDAGVFQQRIRFDVDQFRHDVTAQEALQVGILDAFGRAQEALAALGVTDVAEGDADA